MEILLQLAPLWWTILLLIMFFAMRFYYTRFKKLEDQTKKMSKSSEDIEAVKTKTEHAKCKDNLDKITNLDSAVRNIDRDIAFIRGILTPKNEGYTQANSPISLTEKGVALAKEINANTVLISNRSQIIDFIDKNAPSMNAYDIQQLCSDTAIADLELLINTQDVDKLKLYAYKNGITMFVIGSVLGVMIRDLYFAEKNINVNDVDFK